MDFNAILISFVGIFAFLMISFLLMNVSYIFKGRPFRGGCAQNNPMLKDQLGECQVCGRKGDDVCKMPEVK